MTYHSIDLTRLQRGPAYKLFITAIVAVLAATFVAPAAAAPLHEGDGVLMRPEDELEPAASSPVLRAPIQPLGDCEGGSGSGCPVST